MIADIFVTIIENCTKAKVIHLVKVNYLIVINKNKNSLIRINKKLLWDLQEETFKQL